MRIVDGRVHLNRSGRTSILVDLFVENRLKLLVAHPNLVKDDLVVHGASGTLDSGVRAEVEVILVGICL